MTSRENFTYVVQRPSDLSGNSGAKVNVFATEDLEDALRVMYQQPGIQGRHRYWPGMDAIIEVFRGDLVARINCTYVYNTCKLNWKPESTKLIPLFLPDWWVFPNPD